MQKGIHPENYRPVVFKDMSVDYAFLVSSTVKTDDTIEWEDGNTYPLVKLEISDKSHPFLLENKKCSILLVVLKDLRKNMLKKANIFLY